MADLIDAEPITTTIRGITPETFDFWSYKRAVDSDGPMHVANHIVDGQIVGQKIRKANKNFSVRGKMDTLYGRWLWPSTGKRVVITEGELDALSVSQAQGNKWPVVSVPTGAPGALKSIRASIDWLLGFEEIVLMLDNDEPGIAAAKECAQVFPPGRCKIAKLPLKDANMMLQAGRVEELIRSIWNADAYRPDGIVTVRDVIDKAMEPPQVGYPFAWPTLTEKTFGRRPGDLIGLGAGTGIGKTDWFTQQAMYDMTVLGLKAGLLFLEQDPAETLVRMGGKYAKKRFHIPGAYWTEPEKRAALEALADAGMVMYDNWGACEWATVAQRIEYMATALDCKVIYLDHLTALAALEDDENSAFKVIMAQLAGLAKRLGVIVHYISHLSTPEKGKSHEEGGRVTLRHFRGSRTIPIWTHFVIALERDQQHEDPRMRHITTLRVLKDRFTGNSTGFTMYLGYDQETGELHETTLPDSHEGFGDTDVGL